MALKPNENVPKFDPPGIFQHTPGQVSNPSLPSLIFNSVDDVHRLFGETVG